MSVTVAAQDKPNILVIWGDDVGQSNISAYTRGMMGYTTPNIDRIANEGIIFTDYYAEQSCTAGRASFMLGQSVFRSGLSKVGLPGAEKGIEEDLLDGYDITEHLKDPQGVPSPRNETSIQMTIENQSSSTTEGRSSVSSGAIGK